MRCYKLAHDVLFLTNTIKFFKSTLIQNIKINTRKQHQMPIEPSSYISYLIEMYLSTVRVFQFNCENRYI